MLLGFDDITPEDIRRWRGCDWDTAGKRIWYETGFMETFAGWLRTEATASFGRSRIQSLEGRGNQEPRSQGASPDAVSEGLRRAGHFAGTAYAFASEIKVKDLENEFDGMPALIRYVRAMVPRVHDEIRQSFVVTPPRTRGNRKGGDAAEHCPYCGGRRPVEVVSEGRRRGHLRCKECYTVFSVESGKRLRFLELPEETDLEPTDSPPDRMDADAAWWARPAASVEASGTAGLEALYQDFRGYCQSRYSPDGSRGKGEKGGRWAHLLDVQEALDGDPLQTLAFLAAPPQGASSGLQRRGGPKKTSRAKSARLLGGGIELEQKVRDFFVAKRGEDFRQGTYNNGNTRLRADLAEHVSARVLGQFRDWVVNKPYGEGLTSPIADLEAVVGGAARAFDALRTLASGVDSALTQEMVRGFAEGPEGPERRRHERAVLRRLAYAWDAFGDETQDPAYAVAWQMSRVRRGREGRP